MKEDCHHYGNCTICCCEKKPPLLSGLTKEEFAQLHSERKEVTFKPGEIIFKQGTALTHFACFREGMAKEYFERPEGSNILINIIHSGQLCGSMGLFTDNMHHLTTQALTPVTLCLISIKDIGLVMRDNHDMAIKTIAIKNRSIINLTTKLANLTYKSMVGRAADVMLHLSNDIYKSKSFELNLSRQDLADLAAMTKESFIRSLKEMKDAGLLKIDRDKVDILSLKGLTQLSRN